MRYGWRVTAPTGWYIPQRAALLPVALEQSCVFCGSPDWRYVYLLLNAPQWVQELPWVVNWFVATCASCHKALQSEDDVALASAYNRDGSSSVPTFTELLKVIRARLSEPPMTRALAQRSL